MDGENKLGIKKWALEDRPREKLMINGASNLSNAELLAIIIGSGTRDLTALDLAKNILSTVKNDLYKLGKLKITEFQKFKGIGAAKAVSMVAALELSRRRTTTNQLAEPLITNSADVYDLMASILSEKEVEEFWVILLAQNAKVKAKKRIAVGGVNSVMVDVRIVFSFALEHLASSMILVHNHPSGQLQVSQEDLALTKKIKQGCSQLDIKLLDHIVIAGNSFTSMLDEGLI